MANDEAMHGGFGETANRIEDFALALSREGLGLRRNQNKKGR